MIVLVSTKTAGTTSTSLEGEVLENLTWFLGVYWLRVMRVRGRREENFFNAFESSYRITLGICLNTTTP